MWDPFVHFLFSLRVAFTVAGVPLPTWDVARTNGLWTPDPSKHVAPMLDAPPAPPPSQGLQDERTNGMSCESICLYSCGSSQNFTYLLGDGCQTINSIDLWP